MKLNYYQLFEFILKKFKINIMLNNIIGYCVNTTYIGMLLREHRQLQWLFKFTLKIILYNKSICALCNNNFFVKNKILPTAIYQLNFQWLLNIG